MKGLQIKKVDYLDRRQAIDLVSMLQAYALNEQGGGKPLKKEVTEELVEKLANFSGAVSFLAYVNNIPIGLANCFYGFSTFNAKPLLNIHDLAVLKDHRRKGVGKALLLAVENEAKETNCCKITLEVLQHNTKAQKVYRSFGFSGYNLGEKENHALFWEKKLN